MTNIHLLTLIHGMWGNPEHLAELARTIRELHSEPTSDGTKLHVLVAETNRDDSTYDGIDWGGERVAQEIYDEIDKLEVDGNHVTRFSITGYSLGGLVSRYVVGILHRKKFFDRITPVNFNTIATPHIGLPRFRSFMSGVFSTLGPKLLSRTGEQFYCIDKWSDTERPLLQVMADPDRIFYQALALFQTRRIYANAVNDVTVPFVTAAIETYDPFLDASSKGLDVEINTKYKHLISTFSQPPTPPIRTPKARMFSRQWWKRSRRPLLPPALQFKFPYNLLLYLLIPLLLPVGISLVVVRLSLATRGSRTRIRLLEKDKATDTLMSAIASLEHSVESTVVDIMETDSAPIQNDSDSKEQPVLTPLQISIAKNLNTLPIEKELAYFQDVRNSHAMIVARDVKRFPVHQEGEGILRHWADSFIM